MGRPPKPTALKMLEGTYRADRAHSEAPVIGKPSCPTWLTDKDARKEFRRLAKLLGTMGLVGASDGNLLARYCTTWVRWRRIVQTLAANSNAEFVVYRDEKNQPKSIQVSALHSIARSLADELAKCETVLGMSPAARSRINVASASAEPDPLGDFLNQTRTTPP